MAKVSYAFKKKIINNKMAKIPPWMFIAVGLLVSTVSLFRYSRFIVFFYAGLMFIVVGIVMIISNRIKGESKQVTHKKTAVHMQHSQQIKYCSQCGHPMKLHDRFCARCGAGA